MNEETYRIKPLEWIASPFKRTSAALTPLGPLYVKQERTGWSFRCRFEGEPVFERCDNEPIAKAKAEAYYRERLLTALEPVPRKETT